jgi:sterol desaturase/sphingolipid hydroxylase (fatty acid hydroxylase superfamily)
MIQFASDLFDHAQQWLFETIVQPLFFNLGLSGYLEDAYNGTMWLLIGLLQIAMIAIVFGALQRWRPVEPVSNRKEIRNDILYTLIHRLGLFRLVLFFSVVPLADALFGQARVAGFTTFHVDQVWPGVTDIAWVSFVIYLLIFDAVDYFYHRAQHRYAWFWSLHAVHHSQRQMTMWSDNRNHLLDSVLRSIVFVFIAKLVGVPPGQFVLIVVLTQLVESYSHGNIRLSFGKLGNWLIVSPKFHRYHHSIEYSESSAGPAKGHNFAVLFPLWDILFKTARFDTPYAKTGIHDQLPADGGRDYGRGFWAQQWLGLRRLFGSQTAGFPTKTDAR